MVDWTPVDVSVVGTAVVVMALVVDKSRSVHLSPKAAIIFIPTLSLGGTHTIIFKVDELDDIAVFIQDLVFIIIL